MVKLEYLQKIFFLLVMCFMFVACSSDSDSVEEPTPEQEKELSITGTWRKQFNTGYVYMYFDKEGYGWEHEYDEADGGWYKKYHFTYHVDDISKKIVINWSDGYTETIIVAVLSETKLVLEDYGDESLTLYERISNDEYKTDDNEDESTQKPENEEALSVEGTWRLSSKEGFYLYFDKTGYGIEYMPNSEEFEKYEVLFTYTYDASAMKIYLNYLDGDREELTVLRLSTSELVIKWNDYNRIETFNRLIVGNHETNQVSGVVQGHEYVDLGLSVKWATCNVGANSPEEFGGYYAWGELEEKENYSKGSYKWYDHSENLTKYCHHSNFGIIDNKKLLEPEDDVAYVNWGNKWHMPTWENFEELYSKCSWESIIYQGVKGVFVTGPNGNSIFLPAAGSYYEMDHKEPGSISYWSATLSDNISGQHAYQLYILDLDLEESNFIFDYYRYTGSTVRPVTE